MNFDEMHKILTNILDVVNRRGSFSEVADLHDENISLIRINGFEVLAKNRTDIEKVYNEWFEKSPNGKIELIEAIGRDNVLTTVERYSGSSDRDGEHMFMYYFQDGKIKSAVVGR